ncbi:hypothetical protein Sjap_013689 [Stephania japonica]|uniref:Glycosyltransferase n=1 Tax=Stephania japonica TaxID=461633 RepID=A0AAP0NXX0_9MAGN
MAPGHMIPMIDIGKLLAKRGMIVTVVTTPVNATRFKLIIDHSLQSGLQIHLLQLQFPCKEAGLPEGCENLDSLPAELMSNFFIATTMLQQPLEEALQDMQPLPNCIISDMGHPWTSSIAQKFQIPRLLFHGTSCFSLLCSHNMFHYKIHETITSSTEPFLLPGMPDPIEITKAQLPGMMVAPSKLSSLSMGNKIRSTEGTEYGVVVNSFYELEHKYVKEYQKAKGKQVWCIGPVSLCNKEASEKTDRGNKASLMKTCVFNGWTHGHPSQSCMFVLLIELGLALEASNRPFIWAFRSGDQSGELDNWVRDGFEERVKGRGFIIRGWAPQVLILFHSAIGGFLTHCGWNSALEGICAGVPMITWPMFAEQFTNEKLIVEVLKIGVKVGAEVPVRWGEEDEIGLQVRKEGIEKAIVALMDEGEEGEERRKRAEEVGEKAHLAVEEGGSSYLNLTLLIEDIVLHSSQKSVNE